jgi:hypothetical protein
MPKTAPSAGATDRLNDEVQYLAGLLRFALDNGTVITFTDHDAPITFDDGLGSTLQTTELVRPQLRLYLIRQLMNWM